jgi:hypothetical protein
MKIAPKEVLLAIAPNSRGFGFTLFFTAARLVDWGIKEARQDKNAQCIKLAITLIARCQPTTILLEDCIQQTCRRSMRVKMLLVALADLANEHGIVVYRYSRRQVRSVFAKSGKSKDAIAALVAEKVPALRPWLPRKRRIWESEKHSIAIFEAAALALTHYTVLEGQSSGSNSSPL